MENTLTGVMVSGVLSLMVASVTILPTLLKTRNEQRAAQHEQGQKHAQFLRDNHAAHEALQRSIEKHMEDDTEFRRKMWEDVKAIHISILRRNIFDANLPLSERVDSGKEYLELNSGHNGAGEVQHQLNLEKLRRKLKEKEGENT